MNFIKKTLNFTKFHEKSAEKSNNKHKLSLKTHNQSPLPPHLPQYLPGATAQQERAKHNKQVHFDLQTQHEAPEQDTTTVQQPKPSPLFDPDTQKATQLSLTARTQFQDQPREQQLVVEEE